MKLDEFMKTIKHLQSDRDINYGLISLPFRPPTQWQRIHISQYDSLMSKIIWPNHTYEPLWHINVYGTGFEDRNAVIEW